MNSKTIIISYNTARYLYRFRKAIITELLVRNFKVIVVVPKDEYSSKLLDLGCDVYDIDISNKGSNPIRDFITFLAYLKIYRKIKPDLALHFTIKPNIYGTLAARILGIPCINMITGIGTAFINNSWLTRVVEFLYRFSQNGSHKVLFQNSDDLNLFVDKGLVSLEKVELISSSGVDLSHFAIVPMPNNNYPIFLLIARMLKDKGVVEFVEAARLVKERFPNTRFQLLGQLDVVNRTAITRAKVESWCSAGIVEYLGETDDVRPYIATVDCVVLPSYREGLSRTLLEAAAMGRPIVATDVPGCREIVDSGVSGYLCEVRNVVDLAGKMEKLLMMTNEHRTQMGKKGRILMERKYDEKKIITRYLDLINEVLN